MRRRQRKPPAATHSWMQVRARLFCMLGSHDVAQGTWVRQRRGDPLRMLSCEVCLAREHGIFRPPAANDAQVDGRARRAGE